MQQSVGNFQTQHTMVNSNNTNEIICKMQTANMKTELGALYWNQIQTPTLKHHRQKTTVTMITSNLNQKKPNDKTYIIIIIIHSFYTALFSALEQTHRAHIACDSEWVTATFHSAYY